MNGILYKPAMKQAALAGIKTQTRRATGLEEINKTPDEWEYLGIPYGIAHFYNHTLRERREIRPRYHIGEILFIREPFYAYGYWQIDGATKKWNPKYRFIRTSLTLTFEKPEYGEILHGRAGQGWYLRSPLFLESKDARYFIQITGVKAQRLHSITEEEAIKEGVGYGFQMNAGWPDYQHIDNGVCTLTQDTPEVSYWTLWDSINPHLPSSINPWEITYDFKLIDKPEF